MDKPDTVIVESREQFLKLAVKIVSDNTYNYKAEKPIVELLMKAFDAGVAVAIYQRAQVEI